MFRKKNKGAFDDSPSPKAQEPKTIKVEGERSPNYSGVVRGGKTVEELSAGLTEAPVPTTTSESTDPNYEGTVRKTKYKITEPVEANIRWLSSKSDSVPYPEVEGEIDKYVVDTRIWDRVERYVEGKLDGAGGDGGPHTHDKYADKDHTHDLEEHTHDDYISKESG